MDILVASLALAILSPLLLLVGIAIRFSSEGRMCVSESRWGLWGQPIEILKFRTTGDDGHELTVLGRFLQLFRLDELPLLINVLKGDLSLVGPRALQPIHNPELANSPSLDALPGITGLAQLRELQGDASMDALDLDMQYLATRTLWSDLGLIFATLFTIARAPFQTHGSSAPSRT